jgi:hypothetical protein
MTRLAQKRFTAEIVQLENNFGIVVRGNLTFHEVSVPWQKYVS